jgi:tetratricopeptide (TPR) repeat protein
MARPRRQAYVFESRRRPSRGFTYLKMRQLPEALADYDAALKVDPGQATALFGRGVVRRQMGDVSGGEADIAAAIAIDASVAGRLARRGVVP